MVVNINISMARNTITMAVPYELLVEVRAYQQTHLDFNLSGWFQMQIRRLLAEQKRIQALAEEIKSLSPQKPSPEGHPNA
jgi:hypothetical protein